ncbi:DUF3596 domain-containing protein [Limnobaculum zhutongyuii]|uniref:DUF3596 domain-containing protein n=1 Tax=Limnobaculum zhutongyuii TaxID=2498113 RepID=A0A411WM55_9GAMM|nr:site-specific integrase [Limnobaculum zhutongyuii]QBH97195.1 DUF3596 domain-containing protein [Limnobaculum zhutongyuii]TQS88454.1 DUF3596 domain-containing protein [Limnobaculum zhutongyuii]
MGQNEQKDLPRGITVRKHRSGSTINIAFTYRGVKCREPLSNLDVTPKNIKYAERLLGEIHNKIERGTFNYADHFPKSTRLKIFGNSQSFKTVKQYLNDYLLICENRNLSPSTLGGYRKCLSSLSAMHEVLVAELTPAMIKGWVQNQDTTIKTIRNRLSFFRSAIDEAVTDGLLSINPVAQISAARYKNTSDVKQDDYEVDPFTPKEVTAILSATTYRQWSNLFKFALNTGMRSSELCALRWSNIDFINELAAVKNASVVGIEKGTKTKAGRRMIELNEDAIAALNAQKEFTFLHSDYIFSDPKTGLPWAGADAIRKKAWVPTLKKAGVRYRNPYQTRHTFATMHISRGVNLFWLSSQMGHKGPEMLFRHYGSYLAEYAGNSGRQFNSLTGS